MHGSGYLALAALILLLLPAVILPWEGRRVPSGLYVAIGAGGLLAAGLNGGIDAIFWSVLAGLISISIVTGAVTALRRVFNLQILTSGHIKLLAAGSMWLGLTGTLAMLAITFVAFFGAAVIQRLHSMARRPDFSAIAALAILCVSIQQTMPDTRPGTGDATDQRGSRSGD